MKNNGYSDKSSRRNEDENVRYVSAEKDEVIKAILEMGQKYSEVLEKLAK